MYNARKTDSDPSTLTATPSVAPSTFRTRSTLLNGRKQTTKKPARLPCGKEGESQNGSCTWSLGEASPTGIERAVSLKTRALCPYACCVCLIYPQPLDPPSSVRVDGYCDTSECVRARHCVCERERLSVRTCFKSIFVCVCGWSDCRNLFTCKTHTYLL